MSATRNVPSAENQNARRNFVKYPRTIPTTTRTTQIRNPHATRGIAKRFPRYLYASRETSPVVELYAKPSMVRILKRKKRKNTRNASVAGRRYFRVRVTRVLSSIFLIILRLARIVVSRTIASPKEIFVIQAHCTGFQSASSPCQGLPHVETA